MALQTGAMSQDSGAQWDRMHDSVVTYYSPNYYLVLLGIP